MIIIIMGYDDIQTSLQTTSLTMMGPRGCNPLGDPRCTFESCVGKYYTSNFVRTGDPPYDGFNDRSLDHELLVFAFPDPNNGVTY